MKIENVISRISIELDGEWICFDENYAPEQENRPILTLGGNDKYVALASFNSDLDLLLRVEDKTTGKTEWWSVCLIDLKEKDSEQVEWLIHEMWYELPYECDICDWEDLWYELIKEDNND